MAFVAPPEGDSDGPYLERRKYPPPELEIGVFAAFKIAGIILAPLAIVATLFGVYLQGFRSDLRLDMQRVVSEALDKHAAGDRAVYASAQRLDALREDVDRIRQADVELRHQVQVNTEIIQRLVQKNGLIR